MNYWIIGQTEKDNFNNERLKTNTAAKYCNVNCQWRRFPKNNSYTLFGTVEREEKGKHREETEGWKTDFTVWFQKCKEKAKDLKVRDFCQGPKISICPKWMEKKGKVGKENC